MHRPLSDFEIKEFELREQEKNARMIQVRIFVWGTWMTIAGAFALVADREKMQAYPIIIFFLALFAKHNEVVIDRLKAYLLKFEQRIEYAGYETYNKAITDWSGMHSKALCGAIVSTQLMACIQAWGYTFSSHLLLSYAIEGTVVGMTIGILLIL